MRVSGIITEFNPMHHGHIEHYECTKKITGCDYIVTVMSGNFVQRGEPAIINKWDRTRMALMGGSDLVIELPVIYATSAADYFARAAVKLLASTGVVDRISFGTESGNLEQILYIAELLSKEPESYKQQLRQGLGQGWSFARAQGAALTHLLPDFEPDLFSKPNNTLAIEYCKAIYAQQYHLKPYATHRVSGGTSATKIRKIIRAGGDFHCMMPNFAAQMMQLAIQNNEITSPDDFSDIFRYKVLSDAFKPTNLSEGIENRFRKFAGRHQTLSEILQAVKSKRYTHTRLARAALKIILDISETDMQTYETNGGPQYIRVLGFKHSATALLRAITQHAALPVITGTAHMNEILSADTLASKMLQKELACGDFYHIAANIKGGYRSEKGKPIVII